MKLSERMEDLRGDGAVADDTVCVQYVQTNDEVRPSP